MRSSPRPTRPAGATTSRSSTPKGRTSRGRSRGTARHGSTARRLACTRRREPKPRAGTRTDSAPAQRPPCVRSALDRSQPHDVVRARRRRRRRRRRCCWCGATPRRRSDDRANHRRGTDRLGGVPRRSARAERRPARATCCASSPAPTPSGSPSATASAWPRECPGSVTFVRPPVSGDDLDGNRRGGWRSWRAASSGIRIESTVELPIDVGIRVAGQSRALDLIEMAGPMRAGVELAPGASATLNGGHLLGRRQRARARRRAPRSRLAATSFLRPVRTPAPPITDRRGGAGHAAAQRLRGLRRRTSSKGRRAADRQQILSANVIVTAEPSPAR